jgi:sugar phosphate isomerase/epimerase
MSGMRPVAATTFGFIYRATLKDSLRQIAEAGYSQVELAVGPPHFESLPVSAEERHRVKRQLAQHNLACVSTNPLELNPVTANSDLFEAAQRQYQGAIEMSADLGAEAVVMVAGRRSPLVPMSRIDANRLLVAMLERLLPVAERLGVTLTVEPVPYGFIETAAQALAFAAETDMKDLKLTADCANVLFAGSDPADDLRAAGSAVAVVHISDTWRARWAHTQIGTAEVDFVAFAAAVDEIGFLGPTVYELADQDDPAPRLAADVERLAALGWTP